MMTCVFCLEVTDNIITHLNEKHGHDEEIETWPDGGPVIVDTTLDPKDFT